MINKRMANAIVVTTPESRSSMIVRVMPRSRLSLLFAIRLSDLARQHLAAAGSWHWTTFRVY